MIVSKTSKFKATLLKDDERSGYKKGRQFDPKGVYWQKNKVILVGSVAGDHTIRMSLKADDVEVEVIK